MIPYPRIDPDIVSIGPLRIRWYGVMYVVGFVCAYFLMLRQRRAREIGITPQAAQDLIFYLAVGLVAGARLGYILFYQYGDLGAYVKDPVEIIATWKGGMSFHGGLIGSLFMGWLFSRRRRMPFWAVADTVAVTAPVGLGLGRIGNFVNGELFGKPSSLPWAMVFPDGGPVARHPTQLYEALLEGLLLFLLLWYLRKTPRRDGMMVVFFLVFYGVLRFLVEFVKEPDPQIGYLLGVFTMGQVLCMAMTAAGGALFLWLRRTPRST